MPGAVEDTDSLVVTIKEYRPDADATTASQEHLSAAGSGSQLVAASTAAGKDANPTAATAAPGAAAADHPAPNKAPLKFRMHFVDWVRVFLTVAVLIHHTLVFYAEGLGETGLYPKAPVDFATYMVDYVICGFNQAYFMGLFFLLAGTFSTGSYNRKGPLHYITDRAVRLLIPVVVYDLLIAPIIFCIAQGGAATNRPPGLATAPNVWLWYFHQYKRFGSNPTWFLVALFLFDCFYLTFRMAVAHLAQMWPKSCASMLQQKLVTRPESPQQARKRPYTNLHFGMALVCLMAVLTVVTFVLRIWFPITWGTPYVVSFKLGYFGQYVIAYGLGTVAYLDNALMRMPTKMGYCCMAAAILWYAAGWVILAALTGVLQAPEYNKVTALQTGFGYITGGIRSQAFFMAFFEESFAVLWSVGLMVFARENVNITPNKVGAIIIGAAYAVYVIHPFVLTCYGRAFEAVHIRNIAKMVIVALLLNITTWPLGAGLKGLPYADRVL